MSNPDPVKIPYGYKRVVGTREAPLQLRRGDALWNGMKFERFHRHNRKWPTVSEPGVVVIRRCTVEQPELPGTEEAHAPPHDTSATHY